MAHLHRRLFRVEIDLCNDHGRNFGPHLLLKNQDVAPMSHYILNRYGHLECSIFNAVEKIYRSEQPRNHSGNSGAVNILAQEAEHPVNHFFAKYAQMSV